MKDFQPHLPYLVTLKNKYTGMEVHSQTVVALSAGEAKSLVVKNYGVELSRGEYLITARRVSQTRM